MTATRNDWKTQSMPTENASFVLDRTFTKKEIEKLKEGIIPAQMEDRWFCYFENGTLNVHRSWTGVFIYKINFDFENNRHTVTVNRNREQYRCTSIEEDKKNSLLLA